MRRIEFGGPERRAAALFVMLSLAVTVPAADELERMVTLMTKVGYSRGPSFSPDGKRLAFISNNSGIPQIWVVPVKGGWPAKVTALDDPIGAVRWSPNGDWLAFSAAPGGGENAQVYLVKPDGRGMRRITAGGNTTNFLGPWSPDGKTLAFSSNRRIAKAIDAYIYRPATGRTRLLGKSPGISAVTDIGRDGRRAVVSRLASRGDNNLFLVDLKTRKETLLTPHRAPGAFEGGLLSAAGDAVYMSSNAGRDRLAFARVRIGEDGTVKALEIIAAREDAELEDFDISEDGSVAALLWNVAGQSKLSFVDLNSGEMSEGPGLPAEVAGEAAFSPDPAMLAVTLSGAVTPTDIWLLDRVTGQWRQLTNSPHAGINLENLTRPALLHFRSYDGVELSGWLYRARDAGLLAPVVLSFHGWPEGQERPVFRAGYQALLRRGISVFAPNVRGSAGFGKQFVNMDNGPLRWNAVKDIRACVDYLVRQRIADPKRIGIMGHSDGGYLVMAGLTEYPELFAAGADFYGVVNFSTFFANTEPWMAAVSKTEYGDPERQSDMLRVLSPIHKIGRVKAPVIVLHGANDTNVPVEEAEQVVNALRKRKAPVEYLLFQDEGHGFRKTANRIRATVAVVRWFERYLKSEAER